MFTGLGVEVQDFDVASGSTCASSAWETGPHLKAKRKDIQPERLS